MSFRANRFFNRGLHAGLRLLGTDSVSLPSGLVTIAKKNAIANRVRSKK